MAGGLHRFGTTRGRSGATDADRRPGLVPGMSVSAVRVTVQRMPQRFREALLAKVGQIIAESGDAKGENAALLATGGGGDREAPLVVPANQPPRPLRQQQVS